MTDGSFVSPAVITVKKDKPIKRAVDSRKINEGTIRREAQTPNMEELKFRKLLKKWKRSMTKFRYQNLDFDCAYDLIELDEQIRYLCKFTVTRGDFTGFHRFLKGFSGLANVPTIFQERIDKTLECKHPA